MIPNMGRTAILFVFVAFLVVGLAAEKASSGGFGGFSLPDESDLPDIEDIVEDLTDVDYYLQNLPGFGLTMESDDPITTSLDDAVTDCPFLDNYPASEITEGFDFMPICELQRDCDGNHMLMPGRYEYTIESFCLHAGTHGPGHGDGYLWAPLKGPWSDILYNILTRSEQHPEFSQEQIQYFIWAVLARTPITDMSPEMQQIAFALLTDDEAFTINGGAFGIIQGNMIGDVFAELDLPPEAEMVMRSQADIRWLATEGLGSYEEMEAVAVLAGNPPADMQEREIPAERWSYHPNGYFVRYDPSGYSVNHLEIAVPDKCEFDFADDGSLISIEDEHGQRIELDGSTLRFTCPDPLYPSTTLEMTWQGFNVESMVSSSWTSSHRAEVERVCGSGSEGVDSVVEIGRFAHAVELTVGSRSSGLGPRAQDLVKVGWMDGIVRVNMNKSEGRIAMAKDLPEFDWRDRWAPLDPSDGSANPGNRGSQRLGGRDPRPSRNPNWGDDPRIQPYDPNKRPPAHTAREGMNKFSSYTDKLSWIEAGPVGNVVNSIGFGIPNAMFNGLMEFTITLWDYCTGALSTDPPRSDYDEIMVPEQFTFTPLQSPEDGPAERVAAMNAFMAEGLELGAILKAAVITRDRQGGARMAGDQYWAWEQAKAFVGFEREAGRQMYIVADMLDAYIEELRSEGITDIYVTPEDFADRQDELRSDGFSPEQLSAARYLGLTDSMIDAYYEYQISLDPNEAAGSVMEAAENLSAALRGYGAYLVSLPDASPSSMPGTIMEISP